jgi:Nickel responsive protein SCO4226-like
VSTVIVERVFPEPVSEDDVRAGEDRAAGCYQDHQVRYLRTYVARDLKRMVCVYEAPDAESVRIVQEKARLPYEKLWSANAIRYEGADAEGDSIVVERTLAEAFDEAMTRDRAAQSASCFDEWGCRIVWSYLALDGRRCICVFTAPDAESVRQSQQRAGLPYVRSWPATFREMPAG